MLKIGKFQKLYRLSTNQEQGLLGCSLNKWNVTRRRRYDVNNNT